MSSLGRRCGATTQVVLVVLPAVALVIAAWRTRWMSDDGFIHVRVARQLLAGNGPVFNAGERIEASTSALWVGLLAVVHVITRLPMAEEAVVLGMLLSAFGLVAAQQAGIRLARPAGGGLVLPVGASVVAALPPFWDFATSGMETGLTFAWIGACCWLCAHCATAPAARAPGRWAPLAGAVLVGLGPLIRPDLAVFSVAFGGVLVAAAGGTAGARLRLVAAMVALPAVYQVFRMGYYGQLVPNPAVAKSATRAQWGQGWIYLQDLVGTYWLIIPLIVLVGIAVGQSVGDLRSRARRRAAARLAPLVAALAHAGYIVGIGGDFMHARLLLPALFAIAAPTGLPLAGILPARAEGGRLRVDRRRAVPVLAVGLLASWAVVAASAFRPDLSSREWRPFAISADGIGDERAFYQLTWERQNPVSEADYPYDLAAPRAGEAHLDLDGDGWADLAVELAGGSAAHPVSAAGSIGAISVVWGSDVYVIDALGLAHPIGSRVPTVAGSRIGHERWLPLVWQVAGVPGGIRAEALQTEDGRVAVTEADLRAAREAAECGQLGRYLRDIREKLTPARFLGNVVDSVGNTFLRVPDDPVEAAERFCDR